MFFSAFSGCLSSTDTEPTLVSVSLGSSVSLNCDQADVQWTRTHNGTTHIVEDDDENYEIEEGKLSISDIDESLLGIYSCQSLEGEGTVLRRFQLDTSLKIRKFPLSVSVNDGLPTELTCTLKSHDDQEVQFDWFTADEEDTEGDNREMLCSLEGSSCPAPDALKAGDKAPAAPFKDRAKIEVGIDENDIPFSKLKIQKSDISDRKMYICQAKLKNAAPFDDCSESKECDESQVILRVKDPLAALWPFVGIVAEVIILCIIIFFFEKNRSEDKDDYDEVAGNGNTVASSNIRQRK